MSKFQIIFTVIFGLFIGIGILVFALARGGSSENAQVPITVWGDIKLDSFQNYIKEAPINNDKSVSIKYVEVSDSAFDQKFVEALAVGKGPDIVFLPQDKILRHKDKIFSLPYSVISERTFKDTFLQEGELFLTKDGVVGLPFMADPLVMYWNRDLFSKVNLTLPPKYWEDFFPLYDKLTIKEATRNISQSMISFGEFGNVSNAKNIISAMLLQTGNKIVTTDSLGNLKSEISKNSSNNNSASATATALDYYMRFSNPLDAYYSWNKALPVSQNAFIAGNLAIYFGFASEMPLIKAKNPNLNFDVAYFPQLNAESLPTTYGEIDALAVVKNSKNIGLAVKVVTSLVEKDSIKSLVKFTGLPPVRRDLLSETPMDANMPVFYNSAIRSRGWLDPDTIKTADIFKDMVESIKSGAAKSESAVRRAGDALDNLLTSPE